MNNRGGCERFTDFSLKFIRRPFYPTSFWRTGGVFSIKVAAERKIQTNHCLLRQQNLSFTAARNVKRFLYQRLLSWSYLVI
jgi:hypothetical protein